ncbi:MAG: hypothetical protein C0616_04025 [Desulfuromonas sp.]|nr:MAG: hypothetical protein C0616_04025 [Desulfuromonas sp.]
MKRLSTVIATLHLRRSRQAVSLAAGNLKAALPPAQQENCQLCDLFPEMSLETMAERLLAGDPDLVALPLYLWNRATLFDLARRLKQIRPQLLLATGGPEASPQAEAILQSAPFDFLVRGEGEITFCQLLRVIAEGGAFQEIDGLSHRQQGEIVHNPDRPVCDDPGIFPSPWLQQVLTPLPNGGVLWETARGCTFGCDFCFDSGGHHHVRPFPENRLKAELELFHQNRVGEVWVLDATFNYPPERGKRLLRLIREIAPDIQFHLEAKADYLDRETAALLASIPCSLQLGLQSADSAVLRGVHRRFDVERFEQAINLLNSEGVTFGLDLIYGLPGDDYQGFVNSLEFALAGLPNHIDIFPLAILPGTRLATRTRELGIQHHTDPPYTIEATPTMPAEELKQCRDLASAVDLFYNTGRAVGFLHPLLDTLALSAEQFFEHFAAWLLQTQGIYPDVLHATESWSAIEILPMQEGFVQHELLRQNRIDLLPAGLDLIRFHFHHAETGLGEETLPPVSGEELSEDELWHTAWHLTTGVRLVPFHYEIVDLLEMEGADLESCATLLRPVGSTAIFLRRAGEVIFESLNDDMARLLTGCRGGQTPEQIFSGSISAAEGSELVFWAASEGLIQATSSKRLR